MVDDIVAMRATGPRLQIGREVRVADAECLQIRRQACNLIEAEAVIELQAIGDAWNHCSESQQRTLQGPSASSPMASPSCQSRWPPAHA